MERKCWAKEHSECGRGMSREHYVSQGLFDQKTIFVQGFDWCKNEEVEIGLQRASAKILCGLHNNKLSQVDSEGIAAIRRFDAISNRKNKVTEGDNSAIDGGLFERWLLKTALNCSFGCAQKIGVGMVGAKPGKPPVYLLAVAFGEIPFTEKMGAYFLYPSGEYIVKAGSISIMPVHKYGEIGGFLFHLRGVDVFLALYPGHAPPRLGSLGVTAIPKHLLEADIQYRPPSILTTTNGSLPIIIQFDWP